MSIKSAEESVSRVTNAPGSESADTSTLYDGTYQETSELNYNFRNEITERNLGFFAAGSRYLQSLDYSYNAQGWLSGINQNPLGGTNLGLPASASLLGSLYYVTLVKVDRPAPELCF